MNGYSCKLLLSESFEIAQQQESDVSDAISNPTGLHSEESDVISKNACVSCEQLYASRFDAFCE